MERFLGFVLGRGRTLEEEEDNGGEEGSFNAKFVFSISFFGFLSFDGCIYFSPYVLVSFIRVLMQAKTYLYESLLIYID